jgi:hypothetical protein
MEDLIVVNTFANGYREQLESWCGWLMYSSVHYHVSTDHTTGDAVVRCDARNAEKVRVLQCANPARYGNPPEIKKAIAERDEAFITRFYAAPLEKRHLVAGMV